MSDERRNRTVEVPLLSGGVMRIPVTRCKGCGAEIFWARTTAGSHMPVDAQPTPDGNVVIFTIQPLTVQMVAVFDDNRPRFTSHFATCPKAGEFRKRKPLRRTVAA